jgi:hypothetical protein
LADFCEQVHLKKVSVLADGLGSWATFRAKVAKSAQNGQKRKKSKIFDLT